MPSPFPGMDPYLEDPVLWQDLHSRLINAISDQLQPQLLPNYYANIGERLYVEDVRHSLYPDLTILKSPSSASTPRAGGTMTLVADEPTIFVFNLQHREPYLEIRAASTHEVVAVMEVISPANKSSSSRGREEYRAKQDRVLSSQAHLVEIDLLRRGATVAYVPPGDLLTLRRHDYLVSVNRAEARDQAEVYHFTVRDRFPRIKIPLRAPDQDVTLDLPAAFNTGYDRGAYLARVDYRNPPAEPLRREDEEWADALLREAGLRE